MGLFLRSRTRPTPLLDYVISLERGKCDVCREPLSKAWVELGNGKGRCRECYVWNKEIAYSSR